MFAGVGWRWVQRSSDRWLGDDPEGRQVAVVALTVADGGERRYWLAWSADDTPEGRVVGRFDTAGEAVAAIDVPV
jgi:hypothetical protein